MRFVFTLTALFLSCIGGRADDTPRGIYRAHEVPGSPLLLASGLAWSQAGLVTADRKEKRLVVLRPDGKFETLRKMTQSFGVAFDPFGKMLVSGKNRCASHRAHRRRQQAGNPGRRGRRGHASFPRGPQERHDLLDRLSRRLRSSAWCGSKSRDTLLWR